MCDIQLMSENTRLVLTHTAFQLLTCCSDPREDPALSIFHRLPICGMVFPQDLHTAAPRRGRDAVRVIP